jgi:hypothetical protein
MERESKFVSIDQQMYFLLVIFHRPLTVFVRDAEGAELF